MSKSLSYYYWGHPIISGAYNFGDMLTPLLMDHYCSIQKPIIAESAAAADVFCVGSIVEQIPADKFVVVLGSGKIKSKKCRRLKHARYYALRGPLTKKCLQVTDDVPLGDPGLLMPLVLPKGNVPNADGPIGIVPHYHHASNPRLDSYRNSSSYKIIDVWDEPERVIAEICSCSAIASSSLHGLIISDAYGIPNVRLVFDEALSGGDFKFRDYFEAIGRRDVSAQSIEPEQIPGLRSDTIEVGYQVNIPRVQRKLDEAFKRFANDLSLLVECREKYKSMRGIFLRLKSFFSS